MKDKVPDVEKLAELSWEALEAACDDSESKASAMPPVKLLTCAGFVLLTSHKSAFFGGQEQGYGILVANLGRDTRGRAHFSGPVPLSMGSSSLGLSLGQETLHTTMLLPTKDLVLEVAEGALISGKDREVGDGPAVNRDRTELRTRRKVMVTGHVAEGQAGSRSRHLSAGASGSARSSVSPNKHSSSGNDHNGSNSSSSSHNNTHDTGAAAAEPCHSQGVVGEGGSAHAGVHAPHADAHAAAAHTDAHAPVAVEVYASRMGSMMVDMSVTHGVITPHAGLMLQIYGEGVSAVDVVEGRASTGLRDFANLYSLLDALQDHCGQAGDPAAAADQGVSPFQAAAGEEPSQLVGRHPQHMSKWTGGSTSSLSSMGTAASLSGLPLSPSIFIQVLHPRQGGSAGEGGDGGLASDQLLGSSPASDDCPSLSGASPTSTGASGSLLHRLAASSTAAAATPAATAAPDAAPAATAAAAAFEALSVGAVSRVSRAANDDGDESG